MRTTVLLTILDINIEMYKILVPDHIIYAAKLEGKRFACSEFIDNLSSWTHMHIHS